MQLSFLHISITAIILAVAVQGIPIPSPLEWEGPTLEQLQSGIFPTMTPAPSHQVLETLPAQPELNISELGKQHAGNSKAVTIAKEAEVKHEAVVDASERTHQAAIHAFSYHMTHPPRWTKKIPVIRAISEKKYDSKWAKLENKVNSEQQNALKLNNRLIELQKTTKAAKEAWKASGQALDDARKAQSVK